MNFKMHFGLVVANQNQKTKLKTLPIHFENAISKALHERSNITALFAEHLEFAEKNAFAHSLWLKRVKTKYRKL